MERGTKRFVIVWTVGALAVQAWIAALTWQALLLLTVVAFVLAALAARRTRRATSIVLALAYVLPAVIWLTHGTYNVEYDSIWLAALMGVMLPDAFSSSWRLPSRWRAALICWALVVTIGTPIVLWREIDYSTVIHASMPAAFLSGGPSVLGWILHVATMTTVGILWFDWLFGLTREEFQSVVATPLAVSATVLGAVAAYQLIVRVSFLNDTYFASLHRATGTLFDANIAGAIGALWVGLIGLALPATARGRRPMVAAGLALALITVWASASRTALGIVIVTALFGVFGLARTAQSLSPRVIVRWLALAAAAAAVLGVLLLRGSLQTDSPVARAWQGLPALSAESLKSYAAETLLYRNKYGSAANSIIERFPLVGIGIGCFHSLAFVVGEGAQYYLPPDNAQSWYRHQLAEMGVLGSAGWIVWVCAFGAYLITRRARDVRTWVLRGLLVGFALLSLTGVPAQHTAVAFTLWTACFWFVSITAPPESTGTRQTAENRAASSLAVRPLTTPVWALIAAVVVAYASVTAGLAVTRLSTVGRVRYMTLPLSTGFYWPETDANGGMFRWARGRAAAVIDAPTSWMGIRIGVNHFDADRNPVDAYVWVNRTVVIKARLQSAGPVTQYVQVSPGRRRMLLETWTSRSLFPRTLGMSDPREYGLMVNWFFVNTPPADPKILSP